jgi:hypothetical protein
MTDLRVMITGKFDGVGGLYDQAGVRTPKGHEHEATSKASPAVSALVVSELP